MQIIWSPLALDRVAEFRDYIASDNPAAAEQWVESLFDAVAKLEDFPESGRMVPEAQSPDLREILYQSHRVIYRLEADKISILTVRSARQDVDVDELTDEET